LGVADKNKSITGHIKDIGFFGDLWQQVRLVFYLLKDREVPIYLKILPIVGFLYILFPIDVIADVIPVLGQLDDLTILLIGAKVFIEMAPPQVVARYLAQMRGEASGQIIEGTASDVEATGAKTEPLMIEGEIVDDATSLAPAEKKNRRFWG
jgi:uncharacterized membrane protein YkvA (DUF1232 family)